MEKYIKISLVGGGKYITPINDLGGLIAELEVGEVGDIWTIEKLAMTKDEYNNLPEFTGH